MKITEKCTREESFSFMFGALDMLANMRPDLNDRIRDLAMDMFKLTFPEAKYSDYKKFCDKLHAEKVDNLAQRMNGLVLAGVE